MAERTPNGPKSETVKSTAKRKPGRKPKPEEERKRIIDHVLAELACGRSVKRILEEDEGMPASSCFWRWHFEDADLQEKVAQARAHGVEVVFHEAVDIADDGRNDFVMKPKKEEDDEPEYSFDKEHVLRSKLRVDTRIKYAQMIAPRKYGPKLDLTSGGEKLGLAAEIEAARKRVAEGE